MFISIFSDLELKRNKMITEGVKTGLRLMKEYGKIMKQFETEKLYHMFSPGNNPPL